MENENIPFSKTEKILFSLLLVTLAALAVNSVFLTYHIKAPKIVEIPVIYRTVASGQADYTDDYYIGFNGEAPPVTEFSTADGHEAVLAAASAEAGSDDSQNNNSGNLININTADSSELQRLSGIGEVKAKAIITYRRENGAFRSIEDIKNVTGIGEKTFDNIKSFITVD